MFTLQELSKSGAFVMQGFSTIIVFWEPGLSAVCDKCILLLFSIVFS